MYPSGKQYFPASLREIGITFVAKGLSPCGETDLTRGIISSSTIVWEWGSGGSGGEGWRDVDLNELSNGATRVTLRKDLLGNRALFPAGETVYMGVTLYIEDREGQYYSANVSFEFLAGGVALEVEGGPDLFKRDDVFSIDFSGSMTEEGVGVGDGTWEFLWRVSDFFYFSLFQSLSLNPFIFLLVLSFPPPNLLSAWTSRAKKIANTQMEHELFFHPSLRLHFLLTLQNNFCLKRDTFSMFCFVWWMQREESQGASGIG